MGKSGRGGPWLPPEMEAETDGALLYYMSCRGSAADDAVSNAAGAEFHRRHMKLLYAGCRRICHRFGEADAFAEDLATETLVKALTTHDRFVDCDEPAKAAGRTRAWLRKIAYHLMVDRCRNPNRPGPLTGVDEEIPFDDYSAEDLASLHCDGKRLPRDSETIRLAAKAIDTLDERTRRVVVHTTVQRQRSPGRSYVFRGAAAALAKSLDMSTVNVRRIYSVGVKAIAAYVADNRKSSS